MDPVTIEILAIIIGAGVIGLILKILLFKSIDKAVDNHGRRRHVNNPPREIELSKENENGNNK